MTTIDGQRQIIVSAGEQIKAADLMLIQRQAHILIDMLRIPGLSNAIQDPGGGLGGMIDPEHSDLALTDDNVIPFDMAFCPYPSAGYFKPGTGARTLVVGSPGPVVQFLDSSGARSAPGETDDPPVVLTHWLSPGEVTLTTSVGDGSNPRIDLVEMKLELVDRDPEDVVFSTSPINATLDLDPLTSNVDTVIKARVGGVGGNSVTFALVADGTGVGSLTESGNAVTFHFEDAVTTVSDLETAVGASTLTQVDTLGTGANVLADPGDLLAATPLSGGVNALVLSASLNKARRVQATLQIKEGTPAATPAYPAPSSGFVPVCAVYVPASHNSQHLDSNFRDMRWPLGGMRVYDTHYKEMNENGGGTAWGVDDGAWRLTSPASAGFAYAPLSAAGRMGRLVAVQVHGKLATTGANKTTKLRKMYHNGLGAVSYETICDLTTEIMEPLAATGVAMAHALHFMDTNSRDVGTRVASRAIGTPVWISGDPAGPERNTGLVIAEGDQFGSELGGLVMEYQYDAVGSYVGRTRWFVLHGMG